MKPSNNQFTISASYGWTNSKPRAFGKTAELTAENILCIRELTPFTHLACSGSSGTSMSFILSVMLDIPVIYVRKLGEKSHGTRLECNSRDPVKSYFIIDDFVASGSTVRHIIDRITSGAENQGAKIPKCAGIYLYNTSGSSTLQTKQGLIPIYGDTSNYYKFPNR